MASTSSTQRMTGAPRARSIRRSRSLSETETVGSSAPAVSLPGRIAESQARISDRVATARRTERPVLYPTAFAASSSSGSAMASTTSPPSTASGTTLESSRKRGRSPARSAGIRGVPASLACERPSTSASVAATASSEQRPSLIRTDGSGSPVFSTEESARASFASLT